MIKDRRDNGYMTEEERWTTEHIDITGHLCVPSDDAFSQAPPREGWICFWVTVNLDRPFGNICKVFKYKRVDDA